MKSLQDMRQDAGFTQRELYREMNSSVTTYASSTTTIQNWEDPDTCNTPSGKKRFRLASVLEVPLEKVNQWFAWKEKQNDCDKHPRFMVSEQT